MSNENSIEGLIGADVLNLLKCNICWEFFTEPTILPCGHTFCFKCLNEIGKHTFKNAKCIQNFSDIVIYCPNCRQSVPLKDVTNKRNGVRFNYSLNSIKDSLKDIKVTEKKDASTNTETNATVDKKLDEMESQFKSILSAFVQRGCVTNDAHEEIREIRKNLNVEITNDRTEIHSTTETSLYNTSIRENHSFQRISSRAIDSTEKNRLKELQMLYFQFNPSQNSTVKIPSANPCLNIPSNHPLNYFSNTKTVGNIFDESSRNIAPVSVDPGNIDPAILSYGSPLKMDKNYVHMEYNTRA